jgi:lipopolysaccharide export system protein LptA
MNHRPSPLPPLAFALVALACGAPIPAASQEDLAAEAKDKANSIMGDPRLRNMLRTVKEDPAAALEEAKIDPENLDASGLDPDEAVRQMTKAFADNKNKVDPEKLKSAVATVKESGLVEKATEAVKQLAPEAAAIIEDVPATRPAPGISGGVPTPVAMPVEPGETIAAANAPALSANLPSAIGSLQADAESPAMANTAVDAIAGATPTQPMIPDSPGLTPDEIPAPQPLAKKYAAGPGGAYPAADKQHMEILSKESVMDNAKGILLFTGDVLIDHPEFEIKCDKLEIHMAKGVGMDGTEAGESASAFKRAIASGGMVEIKRVAPDEKGKPKTQIAIARIADYNAVTKDIILSGGPPYIQDGDRFVKTNSEDAQIIMRGNGLYEITGSSNRSQIVIPVEQKGGDKGGRKKDDSGINGFGNAFDGLR